MFYSTACPPTRNVSNSIWLSYSIVAIHNYLTIDFSNQSILCDVKLISSLNQMHNADILELSSDASSPPPQLVRPSQCRAIRNKNKGKERQVIELTDSESEGQLRKARRCQRPTRVPAAGSSKGFTVDLDLSEYDARAPSSVKHNRAPQNLKQHLPASEEIEIVAFSTRALDRGNLHRADSTGESDTRATQFAGTTTSPGRQNPGLTPQIPASPIAPTVHIPPEPQNASPIAPHVHIPPKPCNASMPDTAALTPSSAEKLPPPAPLPPPSPAQSPKDTMSRHIAQVLEIVPDVDSDHCAGLVAAHQHLNESTVEHILHILFEDPNYPRAKKTNRADNWKRKMDGSSDDRLTKRLKANGKKKVANEDDGLWMNMERSVVGGSDYHSLTLVGQPFLLIDVSHRRQPLGFPATRLPIHPQAFP